MNIMVYFISSIYRKCFKSIIFITCSWWPWKKRIKWFKSNKLSSEILNLMRTQKALLYLFFFCYTIYIRNIPILFVEYFITNPKNGHLFALPCSILTLFLPSCPPCLEEVSEKAHSWTQALNVQD